MSLVVPQRLERSSTVLIIEADAALRGALPALQLAAGHACGARPAPHGARSPNRREA